MNVRQGRAVPASGDVGAAGDMTPAAERWIDDVGQHMVGWGLPRTTGRVYGLLLLHARPVPLEHIARALRVAKSGASVSARQLTAMGLTRASGEQGTRRIRYQALHTMESILAARAVQTNNLLAQLRQGARLAPDRDARAALATMAEELETLLAIGAEVTRRTHGSSGSRR